MSSTLAERLVTDEDRQSWIKWLESYDKGRFFDLFIEFVQDAQSECQYCGEPIYCDIIEGGGVPDWGSSFGDGGGLDYGCGSSPDTGKDGTGSHKPIKRDE